MNAQHYAQNHTRGMLRVVVPCTPPIEITLGPLAGGADRVELSAVAAVALQNALHAREVPGVMPGDISVRVRPLAAAAASVAAPGNASPDGEAARDGDDDTALQDDGSPNDGGDKE